MTPTPTEEDLRLSDALVDDLLTCGSGEKADRLEMVQDNPRKLLAGWGRWALRAKLAAFRAEARREGYEAGRAEEYARTVQERERWNVLVESEREACERIVEEVRGEHPKGRHRDLGGKAYDWCDRCHQVWPCWRMEQAKEIILRLRERAK